MVREEDSPCKSHGSEGPFPFLILSSGHHVYPVVMFTEGLIHIVIWHHEAIRPKTCGFIVIVFLAISRELVRMKFVIPLSPVPRDDTNGVLDHVSTAGMVGQMLGKLDSLHSLKLKVWVFLLLALPPTGSRASKIGAWWKGKDKGDVFPSPFSKKKSLVYLGVVSSKRIAIVPDFRQDRGMSLVKYQSIG